MQIIVSICIIDTTFGAPIQDTIYKTSAKLQIRSTCISITRILNFYSYDLWAIARAGFTSKHFFLFQHRFRPTF